MAARSFFTWVLIWETFFRLRARFLRLCLICFRADACCATQLLLQTQTKKQFNGFERRGQDDGTRMRGLARAAGLVSALTLLSRVLGLVREQVYAALLGAGL